MGRRGAEVHPSRAIDDATGKVVAALFRKEEDAQGYFLLLKQVLRTYGIPLDLYHDRHSIFQDNTKAPWTLAEELQGRKEPTQFARALVELGITAIAAHSPQAKGRVERLWGTLQDRLVHELRLAGITDLKAGNRCCTSVILSVQRGPNTTTILSVIMANATVILSVDAASSIGRLGSSGARGEGQAQRVGLRPAS